MTKTAARETSEAAEAGGDLPYAAADLIRSRIGSRAVDTLIILGTGLAGVSDLVEDPIVIPYADIPGFAEPECSGHIGEAVFGRLGIREVAVMRGKIFSFESAGIFGMVAPIRAFHLLGVRTLFYSASVGSLRPEMGIGKLVLVTDHLNLLGTNPLLGRNDERFGDRFAVMDGTYDLELSERVREAARKTGVELGEGIYASVRGPAFETPAEVRMLDNLGADVVGNSLVPEAILSRHCGIRVVAIANVTNLAVGIGDIVVEHEQTLRAALEAKAGLSAIMTEFFKN